MSTAKKPDFQVDTQGVRDAVANYLQPEINQLQLVTDSLQQTGPMYENFHQGTTPPPIVTSPKVPAWEIFGNPDDLVDPGNIKIPFTNIDSDGVGDNYRQALVDLRSLYAEKLQTFLDNQNKFMATMNEFRDRLLDTADEYEATEHKNKEMFENISRRGVQK